MTISYYRLEGDQLEKMIKGHRPTRADQWEPTHVAPIKETAQYGETGVYLRGKNKKLKMVGHYDDNGNLVETVKKDSQ